MKRKSAGTPGNTRSALNWLLLAAAWFAACIAYSPVLQAHWFYDDSDYILQDPRLDHLELFWPSHWHDAPPALQETRDGPLHLPGYGQPLFKDRYLWRLSFALEKWWLGKSFSELAVRGADARDGAQTEAKNLTWGEIVAHADNLYIHLACIAALFFALTRLLALYVSVPEENLARSGEGPFPSAKIETPVVWLPGAAALIFAVHPWAAEPVCYISARDGSMGAFFVLLGLGLWATALQARRSWPASACLIAGALVCALAAFGCKENFITALPGYVLVTWPVLWRALTRLGGANRRASIQLACGAAILAVTLTGLLAWLGISASGRASGLWNQVADRGWRYFFEIQNPILLTTLADQIPVCRLSLEANYPGWPAWACAMALAANAGLFVGSLWYGRRWPLLLGVGWFYLHLLPTNSFLPRPDFLAARNVYLPAAGTATFLAGALLWLAGLRRTEGKRTDADILPGLAAAAVFAVMFFYWTFSCYSWAQCFAKPEGVWARSAEIAPDHGAVRLNLACAMLGRHGAQGANESDWAEIEKELRAAIAAEDSPTMRYHSERPKALRRGLAARLLGFAYLQKREFAQAQKAFRQSWEQWPAIPTWCGWASCCIDGSMSAELAEVVSAGEKKWPNQWWPRALRGLLQIRITGFNAPAASDLQAAEQVPDEAVPELRWLQGVALQALADKETDPDRKERLSRRLKGF